MSCDPKFQKELNLIAIEMDVSTEIALAEQRMTIRELFDQAASHGEAYSQGFSDGFWSGRDLHFETSGKISEARKLKYDDLSRRWGLDDLKKQT